MGMTKPTRRIPIMGMFQQRLVTATPVDIGREGDSQQLVVARIAQDLARLG